MEEITTVDGYTTTYSDDTFIITNSHAPKETEKTVKKVWNDSDDKDGIRPDSITVQLYANGEIYGDPVKLNKSSGWTYTGEGLVNIRWRQRDYLHRQGGKCTERI